MPCYATGAVVYLSLARISDWKQVRGPIAATMACVSAAGYAILLSRGPPGVLYFGCFVVAAGIYITLGMNITWLNTNNPRYGKRTTASGTQIMLGNMAGVVAPFVSFANHSLSMKGYVLTEFPQLYPTNDKPHFVQGHAINLSLVALGACVFAFFTLYFSWENKQRRDGKRDWKMEGKTEEEIVAMGDENPRYMYTT